MEYGKVTEWPKVLAWKASVGQPTGGSNPPLSEAGCGGCAQAAGGKMFDKMNSQVRPSKDDLINIVKNKAPLKKLCAFIENELSGTHQIDYSTCSMAPGWNLKYKKGSRAICTVYPEKEYCGVLITLNRDALEKFNMLGEVFSQSIRDAANTVKSLNGAKWLTVNVTDAAGFEDAKKLLLLKFD